MVSPPCRLERDGGMRLPQSVLLQLAVERALADLQEFRRLLAVAAGEWARQPPVDPRVTLLTKRNGMTIGKGRRKQMPPKKCESSLRACPIDVRLLSQGVALGCAARHEPCAVPVAAAPAARLSSPKSRRHPFHGSSGETRATFHFGLNNTIPHCLYEDISSIRARVGGAE